MALRYDNIYEIARDNLGLISWLRQKRLLGYFHGDCIKCSVGTLEQRKDNSKTDCFIFACDQRGNRKNPCYCKLSIRHNSWFSRSKLSLSSLLKLTYYWVNKTPNFRTKFELEVGSNHTIVDYYNFCREVCVEILTKNCERIGGVNKIVEIDESKFGKRKYHRGKRVDGVWVFGGIERDSGRCFFVKVNDRKADTLLPIIQTYIAPGTTIISDCWAAYNRIGELGYTHLTVNHSKNFKDPQTGACTNTIEGQWHHLKNSLPRHGTRKPLLETYFAEYCVRQKYLKNSADPFLCFLQLVTKVYKCERPLPTDTESERDKENIPPPLIALHPSPLPVLVETPSFLEHSYSYNCSLPLFDDTDSEFDTSMDLFD